MARSFVVALLTLCSAVASAATRTVKVNADGSFSPQVVYISSGDTVEWTLNAGDSIIPVSSSCTARPYDATDVNEFTGPMPVAASGIFSLSQLDSGYVVQQAGTPCPAGAQPRAAAAGQILCPGGSYEATLDTTWQDPALSGVFIRLLWKDIQKSPGTDDVNFDFTVLDREVNQAVKNGKLYSIGIKAGDDGTPTWLFTSGGVTPLSLQDGGSDDDVQCGSRMTLGNPTETAYQNRYFDLLRKVAAHLKSRADWYRALAYVKPSGANLFSHENRLPKRCTSGCICNTQVFSQHGYTPSKLYAFYQAQFDLLATEFPNKTMSYALIQDGFPRVNETGDYLRTDGTSSGGALPGVTEQTQVILNLGQAREGIRFAVAHNGLNPKISSNCLTNVNGIGCPNKWVLQEGSEGQVTGFQTTNAEKVSTPADVDSALLNALDNSQAVIVELYEERFWEAVRQPNGIINPAGSGRTMAQWADQFHTRRKTLFPSLDPPYPSVYRHTFTKTTTSGNQTFYYVNGAKCSVAPASVVILAPGNVPPCHRRAVNH